MLLPATPGWVSLPVVVGGPRHSWLGSASGGGLSGQLGFRSGLPVGIEKWGRQLTTRKGEIGVPKWGHFGCLK